MGTPYAGAMKIETVLCPAELPALAERDLRRTSCVVFDILRATSTFVTALHHGADAVFPVCEIAEAQALRRQRPELRLAGERAGVKIRASSPTERDFDFGNSPREFTPENVRGQTIVSTTTNGTRALRAVAGAQTVLAAAFLNLSATANYLVRTAPGHLLLVGAGTGEDAALEDTLAAGALVDILLTRGVVAANDGDDATQMARAVFLQAQPDWPALFNQSRNARRLLAMPELCADVAVCAQRDVFAGVAVMEADGGLRWK